MRSGQLGLSCSVVVFACLSVALLIEQINGNFAQETPTETLTQAFGQSAASMPLITSTNPHADLALRVTTMPQGHRSRDAQHAYVNSRPLSSSDPVNRRVIFPLDLPRMLGWV